MTVAPPPPSCKYFPTRKHKPLLSVLVPAESAEDIELSKERVEKEQTRAATVKVTPNFSHSGRASAAQCDSQLLTQERRSAAVLVRQKEKKKRKEICRGAAKRNPSDAVTPRVVGDGEDRPWRSAKELK